MHQDNGPVQPISSDRSRKRKSYKSAFGVSRNPREREARRRGLNIPCLEPQIHPLLGKTKKSHVSWFYQLKTGRGAMRTFVERIGAVKSAERWCCGDGEE